VVINFGQFGGVRAARCKLRYIACEISFLEYEALFNSDGWDQFPGNIQSQQRDAMKGFVSQHTFDVRQ
jgi:hypothetical protein